MTHLNLIHIFLNFICLFFVKDSYPSKFIQKGIQSRRFNYRFWNSFILFHLSFFFQLSWSFSFLIYLNSTQISLDLVYCFFIKKENSLTRILYNVTQRKGKRKGNALEFLKVKWCSRHIKRRKRMKVYENVWLKL